MRLLIVIQQKYHTSWLCPGQTFHWSHSLCFLLWLPNLSQNAAGDQKRRGRDLSSTQDFPALEIGWIPPTSEFGHFILKSYKTGMIRQGRVLECQLERGQPVSRHTHRPGITDLAGCLEIFAPLSPSPIFSEESLRTAHLSNSACPQLETLQVFHFQNQNIMSF